MPILATLVVLLAMGIPVGSLPPELGDCSYNPNYVSDTSTPGAVYHGIVTIEGIPAEAGTEIDLYVDGIFIDTIQTGTKWRCTYPEGCELSAPLGGLPYCIEPDAYVAFISGNKNWKKVQFYVNDKMVAEEYYAAMKTYEVNLHNPTGPVIVKRL